MTDEQTVRELADAVSDIALIAALGSKNSLRLYAASEALTALLTERAALRQERDAFVNQVREAYAALPRPDGPVVIRTLDGDIRALLNRAEAADASLATLRAELEAEREKHDEEAYNLMRDAKEAAEAELSTLRAELADLKAVAAINDEWITRAVMIAAPFQDDPDLHKLLHWGDSTVHEGLRQGIAALRELSTLRAAVQQIAQEMRAAALEDRSVIDETVRRWADALARLSEGRT